jgi:hypothetical protein
MIIIQTSHDDFGITNGKYIFGISYSHSMFQHKGRHWSYPPNMAGFKLIFE